MIASIIYTIYLVVTGILPVLYRLGFALSKRKVAIFAERDDFVNLRSSLVDSKLFKEKNILQIDENSLRRAEAESLLLVHWKSFQKHLDTILAIKKDAATLIVYAPTEEGQIESESMTKLGKHRNVIVVNFRGRLINDVLVSMVTSRKNK